MNNGDGLFEFKTICLPYSHNSLAIRAYPGRTITQSPLILIKTLWTDLKTAGAVPAERRLFFTAATAVFTNSAAPVTSFFHLF